MTTTIKNIDERIASIKTSIDYEYQGIGKAYESDDQAGVAYHMMHLKTWKSELAKLEAKRDAEHPTLEESCVELLLQSYRPFMDRANLLHAYEAKYGEDSRRIRVARANVDDAYGRYDHQLEFAAKLLGVDYTDLAQRVREADSALIESKFNEC